MTVNSLKNIKFCRMQNSLLWGKAINQSFFNEMKAPGLS